MDTPELVSCKDPPRQELKTVNPLLFITYIKCNVNAIMFFLKFKKTRFKEAVSQSLLVITSPFFSHPER